MHTAVYYVTRSGNTQRLAEAIAKAVNVEAKTCDGCLDEKIDVLFLGTSLYAGTYDAGAADFVAKNAEKIGLIVNFGTSASGKSTLKKIKALGKAYGVSVYEKDFHCPGHFLMLHKNRPNTDDAANAMRFAEGVLKDLGAKNNRLEESL